MYSQAKTKLKNNIYYNLKHNLSVCFVSWCSVLFKSIFTLKYIKIFFYINFLKSPQKIQEDV